MEKFPLSNELGWFTDASQHQKNNPSYVAPPDRLAISILFCQICRWERCRSRCGSMGYYIFQLDRWPRTVESISDSAQHEIQCEATSTARGSIHKSYPHDAELIRDLRFIVRCQLYHRCLIFSDLCDPPHNLVSCKIR